MTTDTTPAAPGTGPVTGQLLLRAPGGDLQAELTWPAARTSQPGRQRPPAAALVLTGDPQAGAVAVAQAAARAGVLVITSAATSQLPDSSEYLLGWLADHAIDLGAETSRLLLAGLGTAAPAAAAVARRASTLGWPQVSRLLIILPDSAEGLLTEPGAAPDATAALGPVTAILSASAAIPADLQALAAAGVSLRIRRIPTSADPWRCAAAAVAADLADLADLPAPAPGGRPRPPSGGLLLRWPAARPPSPRPTTRGITP